MDKNKSADYYRELFANLAYITTEDPHMLEIINAPAGALGDLQRVMIDAAVQAIVKDAPGMLEMMNMFKLSEIEPAKAARFMYLTGVRTPEIGGLHG